MNRSVDLVSLCEIDQHLEFFLDLCDLNELFPQLERLGDGVLTGQGQVGGACERLVGVQARARTLERIHLLLRATILTSAHDGVRPAINSDVIVAIDVNLVTNRQIQLIVIGPRQLLIDMLISSSVVSAINYAHQVTK